MRQREAAELVVAERAGGVAGVGAAGGQKESASAAKKQKKDTPKK